MNSDTNRQYNSNKNNLNRNLIFIIFSVLGIGIIFLLLFLIIIIPSGNNSKSNKSRTIMIYMVGADLESKNKIATGNLSGINYNLMDIDNVNVVLMAGGAKFWYNDYISKSETSIYELGQGGFEKVLQNDLKNMGTSDTFLEFLNYSYNNYKTDEYDLIIWDHGGGLDGSNYDELYDDDNLELLEFKQALSKSPFNSSNKLETVIFRTCLNGMIEVANIFKDYADYMVSSEEVSYGYYSDGVLNFINDIKKDIDGYKNFIRSMANNDEFLYTTYSIVDLSRIDGLNNSINDFFKSIDVNKNYVDLSRVRTNLFQYGYTEQEIPDYDSVDLYNLVKELSYLSKQKAEKVLKGFEEAVIYSWSTDSKSQGLSIYFPFNGRDPVKKKFLNVYGKISELNDYKDFITNFYNTQLLASSDFSFDNNNVSFVKKDNNSSDFTLELTDEQLNGYVNAEYFIYRKVENDYYKLIYKSSNANLEGNTLKANIKDRLIYMYDDEDQSDFTLFEVEDSKKYIKYFSYGVLESFDSETLHFESETVIIYFAYDKKSKEVKITNVVRNNENGKVNNVMLNLKDYNQISIAPYNIYRVLDKNGNFNENWQDDKKPLNILTYDIDKTKFGIKK